MQWGQISATAADVNTACCSHLSNKPNAFQEKNKAATARNTLPLWLLVLTLLSCLSRPPWLAEQHPGHQQLQQAHVRTWTPHHNHPNLPWMNAQTVQKQWSTLRL
jgi:hypothetical protein